MARKERVTADMILDTAFIMTQEEGFEQVTARKLAAKIGCSTQPIFRVYNGMTELNEALYEKTIVYFTEYYQSSLKVQETPFLDLGMTYIKFAQEEKNLFRLLFLSVHRNGKNMYELLNGKRSAVGTEITRAKNAGCKNPSEMFMKLWIFIHGAACMAITGDYDLTEEDTLALLKDSYHAYAAI